MLRWMRSHWAGPPHWRINGHLRSVNATSFVLQVTIIVLRGVSLLHKPSTPAVQPLALGLEMSKYTDYSNSEVTLTQDCSSVSSSKLSY